MCHLKYVGPYGVHVSPVLAGVSVGRLQGAATANFLADVSVGR